MKTLKYKIIKSLKQYQQYCKTLEILVGTKSKSKEVRDEIELLTFLIFKWDSENSSTKDLDPIELFHSLMKEHNLRAKNLVNILGVSKGMISDILNYKKGLSKDIIRNLAGYFKVSQEAFNRTYKLKNPVNSRLQDASLMNTSKELEMIY